MKPDPTRSCGQLRVSHQAADLQEAPAGLLAPSALPPLFATHSPIYKISLCTCRRKEDCHDPHAQRINPAEPQTTSLFNTQEPIFITLCGKIWISFYCFCHHIFGTHYLSIYLSFLKDISDDHPSCRIPLRILAVLINSIFNTPFKIIVIHNCYPKMLSVACPSRYLISPKMSS